MTEPTTTRQRVRIAHTHTAKLGWQHETTVEIEWAGDDHAIDEHLTSLLRMADTAGRLESARRAQHDAEGW